MREAAEFLRDVPAFDQLPPAEQEAMIARARRARPRSAAAPTANAPDVSASLVAGTINKAFGLNGPYVAINSACASSLQAMLLGARALQLGRVDMAIVGGASDCKSDSLVLFSNARAMSSTGTRPFDSEADGLICGEGYVALVMKTLKRALDDGDRVLAVVRGLGVSSDGKGKSLWAPRKEGQVKAMQRAYRDGLELADLEYVEAHATATKLGDATELNTLKEILGQHFPPGKRIPITSVKANIGHTLETAGIAGVIKTVLAINNETVPPAINIRQLNPNIDWQSSPVYVPTAPTPWPKRADGKPRRAGVNAFGIGGLNMHVVIDEFTESQRAVAVANPGPPEQKLSAEQEAIAVDRPGLRAARGREPAGVLEPVGQRHRSQVAGAGGPLAARAGVERAHAGRPAAAVASGRIHFQFRVRLEAPQGAAQASAAGRSVAVHAAGSDGPGHARRRLRPADVQSRERRRGGRHGVRRRLFVPVATRPAASRIGTAHRSACLAKRGFQPEQAQQVGQGLCRRPCSSVGRH